MKSYKYIIAKTLSKITNRQDPIERYYRKNGIKLGNNCLICSYIMTREPYLLEIGDNVIISTNVTFITHDRSPKLWYGWGDLYGKIKIGNNCFIGENATILYGVELADNTLVAAGSVVTKSFHDKGCVIGGNPARIIGCWDDLKNKYSNKVIKRKNMIVRVNLDESFLVKK